MKPTALAILALAMLALPAGAIENRGTRIAMAVALLDVTEDYCEGRFRVDAGVKETLLLHFHEYDIAGLASMLSRPLNAFYEDFLHEVKQGRDAFCEKAPKEAARTGYPVILSGDP
ncbi:hypothetical protein [Aestuariivirga sp.]|uniref:hypothetical protein n=1 Tax=Aestuariivirga sp. TaxID=2650926 RepID=UPI0035937896